MKQSITFELPSEPIYVKNGETIEFELVTDASPIELKYLGRDKNGTLVKRADVYITVRVIKDGVVGDPASLKVRGFVWEAIGNKRTELRNRQIDPDMWSIVLGPKPGDVSTFPITN